jgi:hypothetical protein
VVSLFSVGVFVEAAHILIFGVVLLRTLDLIAPPLIEQRGFQFEKIGIYTVLLIRLFCPLVAWGIFRLISFCWNNESIWTLSNGNAWI